MSGGRPDRHRKCDVDSDAVPDFQFSEIVETWKNGRPAGHATTVLSPSDGNGGLGPLVSPQPMHNTDIDAAFQCDFRDGNTFGQEQAYSFLCTKAGALPPWLRRGVWRCSG
jgi:hypothetical protein